MKQQFDIKILRQHWIKDDGEDDPQDLCAHGEVYLQIGQKELSNKQSGSWTLSSTALYLMRTVDHNYEIGSYDSQLIPCCGHFFMANEEGKSVSILGCPNGVDWTIQHLSNNQVKHIATSGEEGIIDQEEYRIIVLKFVNQVEQFYQNGESKELPKEEFDRNGYQAFWTEWKALKRKVENGGTK